jgi:Flp pilus assembly protein TadG
MAQRESGQRGRSERGASIVEAPIAIIVITFFAIGVVAFAQIMLSYQHLTGATRAAARYAAKNDYDPTKSPASAARRPGSVDVSTFATTDAGPLSLTKVDVYVNGVTTTDNAVGNVGQTVRVLAEADVNDGAYHLATGLVNGLASFFGGTQVLPYPYRIHSEAVALYE